MENRVARLHETKRHPVLKRVGIPSALPVIMSALAVLSPVLGQPVVPMDMTEQAGAASSPASQAVLLWSYPVAASDGTAAVVNASATAAFDRLLVPLAGERRGLAALDLAPTAGRTPTERWFFSTERGVYRSAQTWRDMVYFVSGVSGDAGRHLYCVRLQDGAIPEPQRAHWPHPLDPRASGVFAVAPGQVIVQDRPGRLASLDVSGAEQFVIDIGSLEHPPSMTATMIVVAAADPPGLSVLDLPTGKTLWRVGLPARPVDRARCDGDVIYLAMAGGVRAFDLVEGKQMPGWQAGADVPVGSLAVLPEQLLFISEGGALVVCRRDDGRVIRRIDGPALSRSLLVMEDHVLYATAQGWFTLDRRQITDDPPAGWADLPEGTRPLGGPVADRGRVYVPLSGLGLTCWGVAP